MKDSKILPGEVSCKIFVFTDIRMLDVGTAYPTSSMHSFECMMDGAAAAILRQ